MLELLPSGSQLWDKPQVFRSAPGAGKSSLLRLFTPTVLLTLHAFRRDDDLKELYQKMAEMGVVSEEGPALLGVFLSCTRNYATLEDLEFDPARKERLLFGLLNARIILAALRSTLALHRLDYPTDLARITLGPNVIQAFETAFSARSTGEDLHRWASQLEGAVCDAIDSFGASDLKSLPGSDTFSALSLLQSNSLLIDQKPVAEHVLLLLDDVHHLTHRQRSRVLKVVAELRAGVGIWLAERFEALSADEMLSSGTSEGRDYEGEILLERFWRDHPRKFETLLVNVADRRARAAVDVEISSLDSCLQASLDGPEWTEKYESIIPTVRERVRKMVLGKSQFEAWLEAQENAEGNARDRAIKWRTLEILVNREVKREQGSFDFPLSASELTERSDSQLKAAAELFLSQEFNLPYYFGTRKLATLASWNIEQFMRLAGDEFEEVVSSRTVRRAATLDAGRQDALLRVASTSLWNEIPRRARNGEKVLKLLESIGRFCRQRTYEPSASYDPGVTGIAISMQDRESLQDEDFLKRNPDYSMLAEVLAAAIANNLLEPRLDSKAKGSSWMVLNLNRLLCVTLDLPLGYGGWKEQHLRDLHTWMTVGYKPKQAALL
ncbi:MAG: hypothetical protein LAP21_21400 [Acidobacteriia bacterium]|nr:hypothetical protein [Terriglobia bacterium]